MQFFAILALILWVPITIAVFMAVSPLKAVVTSLIGAWLILPPVSIPLSGIPDYSKFNAALYGILIGMFLFDTARLFSFRPRWFDLPVVAWCLSSVPGNMINGLGAYHAFSDLLRLLVFWAFPYFIGRLYFSDMQGLRTLAVGIVVGGLCYVPLCLWEVRMGPTLVTLVYGTSGHWSGMRFGGYRPQVFMTHGLEVGMWMSAASLCGMWLRRSGDLKTIGNINFGSVLLPILLITTVLCKASGALMLLIVAWALLRLSVQFNTKLIMFLLILIAPLYYATRIPGIWSGDNLVALITELFDEERAQSVAFRFKNENVMIDKIMEQPIWGCGGAGRFLDIDQDKLRKAGLEHAIPDGLWIIAFGTSGLVGLLSLTLAILLPSILFLRHFSPKEWSDPRIASPAVFSSLLVVYMIDCVANAMINPVYIAAMGGLSGAVFSRRHYFATSHATAWMVSNTLQPTSVPGLHAPSPSSYTQQALPSSSPIGPKDSGSAQLAQRYTELGRALASQGRTVEARDAWLQAIDLWSRQNAKHPHSTELRSAWADCCNDFAWFLLNEASPELQNPSQALLYAIKATESFPERSTYWNTLGAAYVHASEYPAALDALHHSLELQGDLGSGFDYLYLAMACAHLEQHDLARSWYERGMAWTAKHAPNNRHLKRIAKEVNDFWERLNHSGRML